MTVAHQEMALQFVMVLALAHLDLSCEASTPPLMQHWTPSSADRHKRKEKVNLKVVFSS